ncbi:MAG TPA: hypothetical protein VKA48_11135 [Gammaproteobacteria bacterium]|nr:hypothetical protein [Gammaproteobacteria bacterium]
MPRSMAVPRLFDIVSLRLLVVAGFSNFFLVVAITIGGLALFELAHTLYRFLAAAMAGGELVTGFIKGGGSTGEELITGMIKGINTAIIALAALELGMGINKEYGTAEDEDNLYRIVRRTITRFVSLACIALVLEALIMVIKYSQLDLAGNLGYPVAILGGTSALLLGLGGFLALTRRDEHPPAGIGPRSPQRADPAAKGGLRAARIDLGTLGAFERVPPSGTPAGYQPPRHPGSGAGCGRPWPGP